MNKVKAGQLRRWKIDGVLFLVVEMFPNSNDPGGSGDFNRWSLLVDDSTDWDFEDNILRQSEVISEIR